MPVLLTLGVAPEAVLAAYRVGDSPVNAITPLNAYFALVVGFAQKYDKNAGVGTVVSLMLPYVVIMFVLWTALFAAWQARRRYDSARAWRSLSRPASTRATAWAKMQAILCIISGLSG